MLLEFTVIQLEVVIRKFLVKKLISVRLLQESIAKEILIQVCAIIIMHDDSGT